MKKIQYKTQTCLKVPNRDLPNYKTGCNLTASTRNACHYALLSSSHFSFSMFKSGIPFNICIQATTGMLFILKIK
jgi:hypothetical protein